MSRAVTVRTISKLFSKRPSEPGTIEQEFKNRTRKESDLSPEYKYKPRQNSILVSNPENSVESSENVASDSHNFSYLSVN